METAKKAKAKGRKRGGRPPRETPAVRLNLTLDMDLWTDLRALARREDRPVVGLIRRFLRLSVEATRAEREGGAA